MKTEIKARGENTMKLCIECKSRLLSGLAYPCRQCTPFFPNKPQFVLHPDLQGKWSVSETGLKGELKQ